MFDDWKDVIHNGIITFEVLLSLMNVVRIEPFMIVEGLHYNWLVLVKNHIDRDILIDWSYFAAFIDSSLEVHAGISSSIYKVHFTDGSCWLECDRDG